MVSPHSQALLEKIKLKGSGSTYRSIHIDRLGVHVTLDATGEPWRAAKPSGLCNPHLAHSPEPGLCERGHLARMK